MEGGVLYLREAQPPFLRSVKGVKGAAVTQANKRAGGLTGHRLGFGAKWEGMRPYLRGG